MKKLTAALILMVLNAGPALSQEFDRQLEERVLEKISGKNFSEIESIHLSNNYYDYYVIERDEATGGLVVISKNWNEYGLKPFSELKISIISPVSSDSPERSQDKEGYLIWKNKQIYKANHYPLQEKVISIARASNPNIKSYPEYGELRDEDIEPVEDLSSLIAKAFYAGLPLDNNFLYIGSINYEPIEPPSSTVRMADKFTKIVHDREGNGFVQSSLTFVFGKAIEAEELSKLIKVATNIFSIKHGPSKDDSPATDLLTILRHETGQIREFEAREDDLVRLSELVKDNIKKHNQSLKDLARVKFSYMGEGLCASYIFVIIYLDGNTDSITLRAC